MFCKELEKKAWFDKDAKKPCHKCSNIRHEWDLIMITASQCYKKPMAQTQMKKFMVLFDVQKEFMNMD